MDEKSWKELCVAIVDEDQELSLYYKGEEWWISRILTRSKDSYTQIFKTADELFNKGMIDGKPFIERIKDFD